MRKHCFVIRVNTAEMDIVLDKLGAPSIYFFIEVFNKHLPVTQP
jgi:hypothetical protein